MVLQILSRKLDFFSAGPVCRQDARIAVSENGEIVSRDGIGMICNGISGKAYHCTSPTWLCVPGTAATGQAIRCRTNTFYNLLSTRIETVNMDRVRDDVLPFIKDDGRLDIWSATYFRDLS